MVMELLWFQIHILNIILGINVVTILIVVGRRPVLYNTGSTLPLVGLDLSHQSRIL